MSQPSSTPNVNGNIPEQGQTQPPLANLPVGPGAPVTGPNSDNAPGMVTYNPTQSTQSTSSLYVGDLHPDISEAQIFDKFSPIGTVISIRVCRDMVSRKSLGYAYVNFSYRADAEKAIELFNFDELKGRQMRIMWSQRDPSLRKSGVGNIFIKNLDKDIKMRELYDTVSAFGVILSCKIAVDEMGTSKGYGFVHFQKQSDAENAIKNLHGMMIYERKLFVCKFKPSTERESVAEEAKFNNVFVKNFGDDMTPERLKELFEPFGEILSSKLEVDEEGNFKGFGFVCYKECEGALKAVGEMHDKEVGGRKLFVGRALKKSERAEILRRSAEKKKLDRASKFAPGVNLYVKNLDDSVTDDMLRREFAIFGTITSAKVMVDGEHGRSKGFGFVCFQFAEEATRAVTEMSGKYVGSKPLYVALAQRKDERRQQLASQYVQRQINRNAATAYNANPGANPAFGGMPGPMYNQNFNNQPLTFALNRPGGFMNSMPQMAAAAAAAAAASMPPRGRFTQGGMPPSMRHNLGATNAAAPTMGGQMAGARPNAAQIRALNSAAAAGGQFNQNLISINANNMRPQGGGPGGGGLTAMTRQPMAAAAGGGANTRFSRPPQGMAPQYRASQQGMLMPQQMRPQQMASMVQQQQMQQQMAAAAAQQQQMVHHQHQQAVAAPQQQGGGGGEIMDDAMLLQNLDGMEEGAKHQILGETLFKHVSKLAPIDLCSKVTGMLLEKGDIRSVIEQHIASPNGSRLSQTVAHAVSLIENQRQQVGGGGEGGDNKVGGGGVGPAPANVVVAGANAV